MSDITELKTKEALAYDRLKELIVMGELPRNEFLSQRMLAKRIESTIISVRGALRQLENDGLIENVPRWGVRIPAETEETVQDRYFLRQLLEVGAVQRFKSRKDRDTVDDTEVMEKAKACDAIDEVTPENLEKFAQVHFEFHHAMAKLSKSPLLIQMLLRLNLRSQMLLNAQRGWAEGYDHTSYHHQNLAKTVLTSEEETAIAAIREHISHGLTHELEALRSPG